MSWFLAALKKYVTLDGRARRREFWFYMLFYAIFAVLFSVIDLTLGTYSIEGGTGLLSTGYALGTLLPTWAVAVRRLHDIGRSGWWLLLNLIPIIGWIVLLVFKLTDSQPGTNQYGENPKGVAAAA